MRIVLTGGGTGGHLFPLIAVKRKIKEIKPETEFLFMGPKGELEEEIMEAEKIKVEYVLAGKMRRYFSFQNFLDIFKIKIGFFQALCELLFFMPDVIFAKGGYASIPVVLAGWLYRIPILIHESDSTPGMANSILAKFSQRVAISYSEAEKEFSSSKVVLTGNPLREDINQGNPLRAKEKFNLTDDKKIVLVLGGSQGSQIINRKIVDILPELLKEYQIIHQTGVNNYAEAKTRAARLGIKADHEGYYPIPFLKDELKDVLAVADLVISRSGANSISEVAANGKPSILIPIYKSANNHQRMNAYYLAQKEACFVLEENNLGENLFLTRIKEIMDNEALREKFSQNIKQFYHADATEKIAQGILEIAK